MANDFPMQPAWPVGWSDFEKNVLTLSMLCQIFVGTHFQNFTFPKLLTVTLKSAKKCFQTFWKRKKIYKLFKIELLKIYIISINLSLFENHKMVLNHSTLSWRQAKVDVSIIDKGLYKKIEEKHTSCHLSSEHRRYSMWQQRPTSFLLENFRNIIMGALDSIDVNTCSYP